MSDNIFKNSSFKKNVSKDNNDKGKSLIKDDAGKNYVSVNSSICKVYLSRTF